MLTSRFWSHVVYSLSLSFDCASQSFRIKTLQTFDWPVWQRVPPFVAFSGCLGSLAPRAEKKYSTRSARAFEHEKYLSFSRKIKSYMIKSQTYKPVRLQFWNLFHGCLFRLLSFFLFCRETFLSTEKMLINTTVLHKKVSIQSDVFFSQNTAASTRVRTWGIPKEFAVSLIEAFQRYYRINHMCDVSKRSPYFAFVWTPSWAV